MIRVNETYIVTGGTGFLGQALIERIISVGGRVRTVARNEGNLLKLKQLYGEKLEIFPGDIADRFVVEQLLNAKFDGIFHLAAFKHVPLAETFSLECINSNVTGSLNILDASRKHNPGFIIGISTDKAAQVAGVYGASKLLMEKMFEQYEKVYRDDLRTKYRIVRYGNVLYSTGSVLCKWKDLLEKGGSVEIIVTEPKATRFFWTLEQAIDLIFSCLCAAKSAKPYVPTMKSIAIGDLLEAMILKYGKNSFVSVKEIGLQKGENLHEKIMESGSYSNEVEKYSVDEIMQLI